MIRALRPRDLAFLLFALAIGTACLRLGIWQLDRLAERRQLNAEIRASQSMPAIRLNTVKEVVASDAYRLAIARGTFDFEHQVLLSNRSLNGEPGVHWVVPLRLESRTDAVLVDRGWLPLSEAEPSRLAGRSSSGAVEIQGVLLPTQTEPRWRFMADRVPGPGEAPLTSWRVLNLPGIQAQTPFALMPVYLAASEPPPDSPLPRPDITIDLSEGPHLGYAIQWFAFCAIAWVGAGYYTHRRFRENQRSLQE